MTIRTRLTDAGPVSIVKDPVSGRYYRMREAELYIAQQFDGATALEVVRQRTEEHFGAELPASMLDAFLAKLDRNRLLDSGDERPLPSPKREWVSGSLLYLRFKVFDPGRLFERLLPVVRFCFTPAFFVFSLSTILVAAGVLIANWSEFLLDLRHLYRFATIPLFIVISCLVVSLHEAAHGLACTRYGGQVRETGFMLIYFQPALYVNVSDAWLFPEKSKRLWVGFAGPYFELFVWALATLTWWMTEVDTIVSFLSMIVMTGSGIKTLLNFNPLLKLDGYYLLSDYLEIHNLRRRSYRLVGSYVERIFGIEGKPVPAPASRREKRILLTYGIAATVGSFLFLTAALFTVGSFLIASSQQLLLVVFSAVVGFKVRRRVRRLFGWSSGRSDPEDDDDDADDASAAPAPPPGPVPVDSRKKSRKKKSLWPRRLAWLAVLGAIIAALFLVKMELRIAGSFDVRPISNADVRAAVDGIIEEVFVDEGQRVEKDDPIARLSDKDLRVELKKTELEMREEAAKLELLQKGPTSEEISVAQAAVVSAQDQLTYARSKLSRQEALRDKGLVSAQDFENQQELVAASSNRLEETQARLDALLRSIRPEQLDAMKASVERLGTQRHYLDAQVNLSMVRSPATGVVVTPSRELKELRGKLVAKGDLVAKVFDFETVTAFIAIPEKEIADVHLGQEVVLRTRAYPDAEFRGKVVSIGTSALTGSASGGSESSLLSSDPGSRSSRTILVTTEIDNREGFLKPDMSGRAKILCGERRLADLLVRRFARTLKVDFWSWF